MSKCEIKYPHYHFDVRKTRVPRLMARCEEFIHPEWGKVTVCNAPCASFMDLDGKYVAIIEVARPCPNSGEPK